ncbi:hypothetical protein PGTUg99_000255 [Puccinia graminis f. sp. tritici]|uniref:Uncharacterized protein n=1 Tax=Puccinia graminis f. sp. tritici TaxID=56615 RepID=A0A5B0MM07_PUCGR|nr:hypothetical protein PGTUg99_000255 [Puccinia graminis f. sp. tritici]
MTQANTDTTVHSPIPHQILLPRDKKIRPSIMKNSLSLSLTLPSFLSLSYVVVYPGRHYLIGLLLLSRNVQCAKWSWRRRSNKSNRCR